MCGWAQRPVSQGKRISLTRVEGRLGREKEKLCLNLKIKNADAVLFQKHILLIKSMGATGSWVGPPAPPAVGGPGPVRAPQRTSQQAALWPWSASLKTRQGP